ncbi:MAG: tRNA uridine-5-carboxymethylaminomethyl(34) synthesis GTPase MnmE [Oscillospiraceae bacterium]|nr:tRNA uridine-5-carboxymethylaminomethyl(34) synthesis GTPase MnmE [Oscillospiraceae bacterium]
MSRSSDTIVAAATAAGRAAIGVIRISGESALGIAQTVFKSRSGLRLNELNGYQGVLGRIFDRCGGIDEVIAFVYRAPKSFTGEDVVEFSCHGGSYIIGAIVRSLTEAGARMALPGEFTRRAVMNGKLTVSSAEAINEMINAKWEYSAKTALAQYDGALSVKLNSIKDSLYGLAAELAVTLEFPEDDIELDRPVFESKLRSAQSELSCLVAGYARGKLIREGIPTVIAGKPNTGKSTVMNLLCGTDKSIVTDIEGTTRDVVEDYIDIGGVCLKLADTAGIRENAKSVERIGVDRSKSRIESAGIVLAVFDLSRDFDHNDRIILNMLNPENTIVILNKSDLPCVLDTVELYNKFKNIIPFSAKSGDRLQELYDLMADVAQVSEFDTSEALLFSARQLEAAKNACEYIDETFALLAGGMLDAAGVCLESALESIGTIDGENISEGVIEEIFRNFCIGK